MGNNTQNSLLYYPTIIPPKEWMYWALFYWDKIFSIIPKELEDALKDNDHKIISILNAKRGDICLIQELLENYPEYFEPKYPEEYFKRQEFPKQEFIKEVQIKLQSIQNYERGNGTLFLLHKNKIPPELYDMFMNLDRKLLWYENNKLKIPSKWTFKNPKTAIVYMAILAKYISIYDTKMNKRSIVEPITDKKKFEDYAIRTFTKEGLNRQVAINIAFPEILPVPNSKHSLKTIIKFKEEHKYKLLRFREFFIILNVNSRPLMMKLRLMS